MEDIIFNYPRPQMVRDSYLSLNGKWNFAIVPSFCFKDNYNDFINVPFSLEANGKKLKKNEIAIYHKHIKLNNDFLKDKLILHLDGADQLTDVYVDNKLVKSFNNGYLPNQIILDNKEEFDLVIAIKDNLDLNYPYGKQAKKSHDMWYTSVSGIWKDVWLEAISDDYIANIKITPNIDNNSCNIKVESKALEYNLEIYDDDKLISSLNTTSSNIDIIFNNPKYWDIDNPFLYHYVLKTKNDMVKGYFALRKFSYDKHNFYLNNKKIFLHGLLDQGYFSKGIYTPSSPKCFYDDIKKMKDLGFNTLRKHIKIEPLLYYYYADVLGMIILQDFVNVGKYHFLIDTIFPTIKCDFLRFLKFIPKKAKANFKDSIKPTIDLLYNCPSVCYYTIFNEGWGQHNANYYYDYVKLLDNTRVIDSASGWFKVSKSDVISLHHYFFSLKIKMANKPVILSEFGGYSLPITDHRFNKYKEYGYAKFKNIDDYNLALEKLYDKEVINNIPKGLAGAIYTQVSDVEDETNGLLTMDREILKVNKEKMLAISKKIKETFDNETL